MLLQNALLFTLIALPSLYFGPLSRTVAPMRLSRLLSFAVALLVGCSARSLAFGAEPLTLTLYFLLFGADGDEGAFAALTVFALRHGRQAARAADPPAAGSAGCGRDALAASGAR